jgi:hypothetical protein
MMARKQAESISSDEMPPCTVRLGVRWMDELVNWSLAAGKPVGERDWETSPAPRAVWMGVVRTGVCQIAGVG